MYFIQLSMTQLEMPTTAGGRLFVGYKPRSSVVFFLILKNCKITIPSTSKYYNMYYYYNIYPHKQKENLICIKSTAVCSKCNIERHYHRCHKEYNNNYLEDKSSEFKLIFRQQQCGFTKSIENTTASAKKLLIANPFHCKWVETIHWRAIYLLMYY